MCRISIRVAAATSVLGLLVPCTPMFAIDPRGIHIGEQWSVVGVIADGATNGIAVIRELGSDKTYTVKIGDEMPDNADFRIQEVRRKQVVLTDGHQNVTIDYQAPSKDAWGEEETVSRFAESYFNGFSSVPIEYFQGRKGLQLDAQNGQAAPFAIKKLPEDSNSVVDIDLSNSQQVYDSGFSENGGFEEDPAASDVVVDYDNMPSEGEYQDATDPADRYRRRLRTQQPRWETVPKRVLDEDYGTNQEVEGDLDVIYVEEAPVYEENQEYEDPLWQTEEEPTDW